MCAFVFAGGLRGATIIDSLDTLYIMGLMEEYEEAKKWVETDLDLNSVRSTFSAHLFFSFLLSSPLLSSPLLFSCLLFSSLIFTFPLP